MLVSCAVIKESHKLGTGNNRDMSSVSPKGQKTKSSCDGVVVPLQCWAAVFSTSP